MKIPTPLHVAALLLAVCFAIPTELAAQDQRTRAAEQQGQRRFWQVTLPGGSYIVALDRIAAVGKHEYLVDGNFLVTEVTVDTLGHVTARFYSGQPFTPTSPLSAGQVLIDRTRGTIDSLTERTGAAQVRDHVIKNYPQTTHAKTIEFNVVNLEDLNALYDSLSGAVTSGRGARFTIRED